MFSLPTTNFQVSILNSSHRYKDNLPHLYAAQFKIKLPAHIKISAISASMVFYQMLDSGHNFLNCGEMLASELFASILTLRYNIKP